MDSASLLSNPAVQSGFIPFITTLIFLLILRPMGWFWSGLALAIAFYASVYLTVGFQFTPFTSTRKILLLGIGAIVIGLILDTLPVARKNVLTLLGIISICAVIWMLWPVLKRKETLELVTIALSASFYIAWLTVNIEKNRLVQPSIFAGVFAIAIGTSISTLLGASALLGQLAGAIGAAAGAFILINLLSETTPVGTSFTFPAALILGLCGIAGVVYADMPWYALIPIALIPLLLNLHLPSNLSKNKRLLSMCAFTMALALLSIFLTWQIAGAPPF